VLAFLRRSLQGIETTGFDMATLRGHGCVVPGARESPPAEYAAAARALAGCQAARLAKGTSQTPIIQTSKHAKQPRCEALGAVGGCCAKDYNEPNRVCARCCGIPREPRTSSTRANWSAATDATDEGAGSEMNNGLPISSAVQAASNETESGLAFSRTRSNWAAFTSWHRDRGAKEFDRQSTWRGDGRAHKQA